MKNISVIFLLVALLFGCGKENHTVRGKVDSTKVDNPNGLRVKATSGLNMRKEPSLSSIILRLIPDKSRVKLLKVGQKKGCIGGKKGYWVQIEFKGLKGWVFDAFLQK